MGMPVITTSPDASEYWVEMIDQVFRPVPDGLTCDVVLIDGTEIGVRVLGASFRPGYAYGMESSFPAIEYRDVDEHWEPVGPIKYLHEYDFTGMEIR